MQLDLPERESRRLLRPARQGGLVALRALWVELSPVSRGWPQKVRKRDSTQTCVGRVKNAVTTVTTIFLFVTTVTAVTTIFENFCPNWHTHCLNHFSLVVTPLFPRVFFTVPTVTTIYRITQKIRARAQGERVCKWLVVETGPKRAGSHPLRPRCYASA
jgi:hypothetical protein